MGSTQPPNQSVRGAVSPGLKRLEPDADHTPPSSSVVKNGGAMLSLPICFNGLVLNY
jgi:hypothetical protein